MELGNLPCSLYPFSFHYSDMPLAPTTSVPSVSYADLVAQYQCLISCLLYLAIATCPDISFYAMWLGQFNANPTQNHLLVTKHILRYLAGTCTLALCLGAPLSLVLSMLSGYMKNVSCSDADWASDAIDRKSISGYSFFFQGSLVSWSAVKQKAIALSSTEAEYHAMAHAFKEALWLCSFLSLLKLPVPHWLFPFLVIIRLLALSRIHWRFLLTPNTLIFVTILFAIMFKLDLFQLFGYLLLICQLIFLPRPSFYCFFLPS